ncbi:MAG: SH3 domain-containing protein [Eubacteriales bacterium]|nr:SH3 domain-containing protein [Eubacteriales bacterium]
MNFSTMKMLRKILSLAIVMCMMVTLFTGCFKKKDTETTPSTEPPLSLPTATEPSTEPAPTVTEPVNENMATVLSTLKVRSTPSEESPETDVLEAGTKVEVLQTQDPLGTLWGYVSYGDDKRGWVQMDYVQWDNMPDNADDPAGWNGGDDEPDDTDDNKSDTVIAKGTVAVNELNIRKSASQNSDKVGVLKSGARVEILEKKGDWGRIEQGWISLQHVKLDGSNTNTNTNTSTNTNGSNVDGNGSTKVQFRGIVVARELNVREGAGTDYDKVDSLPYGTRVEILEKSGSWGRVKEGWISLGYVFVDGSDTDNKKTGTVTGDDLNIRIGPGTKYDSVGSLDSGDDVTILFQLKVGDTTWGNIKQGWISMKYVDLDDDDDADGDGWIDNDDDDDDFDEGNGSTKVQFRGIVTADKLNIRRSADSDSDSIGSYTYGARVEILEEDDDWGRTKKGWISLDYVYADGTGDGGTYGTVTTDDLNIRSGPDQDYDRVGGLDEGDEVEVLFTLKINGSTWYNIEDGWISGAYVDLDD